MSQAIADDRLVLTDGSYDPDRGIVHAAAPFIIGLVAAVIGMAFLAPYAMRQVHVIVGGLLIPSLIVSVGLYALSVLAPGDLVGLVVDRRERVLVLVQANSFASRTLAIPFDDVHGLVVEESYDQDGYGSLRAVIVLKTGERMPLAFGFDEATADRARAEMGLVASRRS